ncbi:TB182 protein, partial [Upupa epops]|nr:TB182 protein [Upupa epops]
PSLAGSARPKPPIRPKPRVLPKPAVPAKPTLPQPQPLPGPRHPRPELPSAEKMNRLAGPQPYGSGGSVGGPLRRPFFTLQSADTPNGKGRLSPPAAEDPGSDPGEELPPAPPTPSRKGPAPFKVTPVPVAAKPERFPGTTVEEILAKMDSREGPGGREQARLVPFCPDPSSRFGSRTFTALRRCPSKEADAAPPGEAPQTPQSAVGKPGVSGDGRPVAEMSAGLGLAAATGPHLTLSGSRGGWFGAGRRAEAVLIHPLFPSFSASSSPSAGPGCAGDPRGCCQTPSPPDVSPRLAFLCCVCSAPGLSPSGLSCLSGAPSLWGACLTFLLGVLVPPVLGAWARGQVVLEGVTHASAGAKVWDGRSCESPARVWWPSSPPPTQASRPPGSPEEPDDSPVSLQLPEGLSFGLSLPSRASGLRRSSEGVLKTPATGQGLGELGGSMKALPHPGDPLPEPPLGSDSGWSLSQSFEWTFPSQGAQRPASPLQSPIVEADYSGLSEDGEDAAPSPPRSQEEDSGSDDSRGAEGSPCPGGPVALRETKALVKEEEEKKEEDAAVPCSPPCVTEPVQDLPEPESQVQPGLADTTPLDVATEAGPAAAWVPSDDCARSPQGPGGPCRTGGSSNEDPPGDPGWLAELLASPRPLAQGCSEPLGLSPFPQGLLGWSRKDLCWEFGVRAPHAGAFDWSHLGPGLGAAGGQEEVGAAKAGWSSSHSVARGQQRDAEPSSGQPSWASRPGPGDLETRHGEVTPAWAGGAEAKHTTDWAGKCSSRRAESRDGDLTLGWAGRTSTEDPGSLEKECGPSRAAWGDRHSSGDMESQDREFSPSRPAEASKHSTGDTEPWHGQFSPSQPTWEDRYSMGDMGTRDRDTESQNRDTESQDREFSPSRLAEASKHSTSDSKPWHREFSPGRPTWEDRYSMGDMGTQDQDTESQDREFSPSRPAWAGHKHSTSDTEPWHRQFSPGRPTWEDRYSMGDMGTQERDTESQDWEFSPSRPALEGQYSMGDMGTQDRDTESQDREFKSSRAAEATEHPGAETWGSGLGRNQPTWDDRYSIRAVEARPEWADGERGWAGAAQPKLGQATGGQDSLPGSGDPDPPLQEHSWRSAHQQEHSATGRRDWPEELGTAHSRFGIVGTERVPDPHGAAASPGAPTTWTDGTRSEGEGEPPGAWHGDLSFHSSGVASDSDLGEPGWSTELRDAEAKRREWASAFGARCAARSRDCSAKEQSLGSDARSADGTGNALGLVVGGLVVPSPHVSPVASKGPGFTRSQWHHRELAQEGSLRLLSWELWVVLHPGGPQCPAPGAALSRSVPLPRTEAGDPMGAPRWSGSLCAQSSAPTFGKGLLGVFPDPSPPTDDAPAMFPDADPSQSELPGPTEEEQDPPDLPRPLKEEQDPPETLLLSGTFLGAVGGTLPDVESEGAPSDHLDGKRPPSWEEKQLPLGTPQPEAPVGQEFAFLEDTEVLDSSMYRTKASLGRKRRHRAPALRPGAATEGDAWIFWDSTEPRPAPPAASSDEDEEAAEEPKSRRARAFPAGRGVKVPLFPGLSTAALKAKLRGRNRSAEEGSVLGDSRGTPPKDSHLVQRSKSCKILGLSGKPPALPPKPDKSSGSEASPPHWLQALKLKKKK